MRVSRRSRRRTPDPTLRLSTLSLPDACRSATHSLSREVLAAALAEARAYDRAAGFFSSTVLSAAPEAFGAFFRRDGAMRLVCSPVIGAADLGAVQRAFAEPGKALADLPRAEDLAKRGDGARALAAWLARGDIRVQVAIPTSPRGLYHEKIGVFTDNDARRLAISGSANESKTAWTLNFERVDLFPSWEGDEARRRCVRIEQAFEDLWRNRTPGLTVVPLHEALADGLLQVREMPSLAEDDRPRGLPAPTVAPPPELIAWPPDLRLFRHQEDAIRKWAAAGGRGILAMATGAGKTLTALALATRLAPRLERGLVIIVVAPFIHLVDQWCENARRFGLRPVRVAVSRSNWEGELALGVNAVNAGQRPVLSMAVTQATLATPHFQELLARVRVPMLVIGDEVHNLGTADAIRALPARAPYRLGLSATPERHRDPDGTARIVSYFGKIVHRYDLARAIEDEVLTPYRYFPIPVELEDDELIEYLSLSKQLARYIQDDEDESGGDLVMRLLLKRARLLASARRKLDALREILEQRRSDTHILVYCGDGQVEGPVPEGQQRQVEAVVALIGNDLRMRCASYTAATPPDRRQELLTQFAEGTIQVLVAIRCLDEGVDVPSTRTAIILASSSNPRQFVQRRGRILRRAPGKDRAELFDLVVCPDLNDLIPGSTEYTAVRKMLASEFKRVAQFAALAVNGPVARRALATITERLALHEEWYTPPPSEEMN